MYYNFQYWLEHAIEKSLRLYNGALLGKPGAPPDPINIKKILICAYHGIGNFILYTPTIAALKKYFPNASIDLQVGNRTGCEAVLAGSDYFANTFDISNRGGWREWWRHIRAVRRAHYDMIISEFHSNSYFLAMMVSFSGARYRVGHVRSPGWPDRYGFIYNVPVKMAEAQHEMERYFALARALGISEDLLNTHPFIHIEARDESAARELLAAAGAQSNSLIIGVQMGTSPNMRWKQWQPERYRLLIAQLAQRYPDAFLLMLGSANEVEMIQQWTQGIDGNIIIAAGRASLKATAALIQRCALLICNDSGLMHVAVATGTPAVAIFGPTDYRRTAPIGAIHTMIRKDLPCSPCFKMEGDAQVQSCPHHDCLNTISVEEVLQAVMTKLMENKPENRR
jgi:lipopolysaccharide heptosyltransferase II